MKDVFVWQEDSFTIDFSANEITNARSRNIIKKVARVFEDGKQMTQAAIGDCASEILWQQCLQNYHLALPAMVDVPRISSQSFQHQSKPPTTTSFEKQIGELLAKFSKDHPDFIAQGKFSLQNLKRAYTQDSGGTLCATATSTNGYLCLKYKDSGNIIDHVIEIGGDATVNIDSIAQNYSDFLDGWTKEATLKQGKKNVCFVSETSGLLAKLAQALNPETYHAGASLFSNKIGTPIFHEQFTLLDVAVDPQNGVYRPFDDEGILCPCVSRKIIANGIFSGPLYDLRTAKKFHTTSTGNAHRYPIPQGIIAVTPNSLDFSAGRKSIREYWHELGEVIVVLMAGGGDTTADGNFSTPAQLAFLVKDGKVRGRLPQITLCGNICNYLGEDFIGISNDRMNPGSQRAPFMKLDVLLN